MAEHNDPSEQAMRLAQAAKAARTAAEDARAALGAATAGTLEYEQALNSTLVAQQKSAEAQLAYARSTKQGYAAVDRLTANLNTARDAAAAHTAQMEAAAEALAKYNAQAEKGYNTAKQLGGMIGLQGKDWENHNSMIFASAGGLKGLGKAFGEIINPMNLAGSVMSMFVQSTIELTMAADKAYVALNKQTGMTNQFKDQIKNSERALYDHGITIDQVAGSYGELITQLGKFTDMSKDEQSAMAEGVALLDKFGISASQTVANLGTMTDAMGMTGTEAINMQKSLLMFANENEIAQGKMMADFASVADEMAVFGDQGVEVFGDLALAAKKSNMEVSELLGLATQFDTFDGATKAVGELNALLGGPFLNSLEMVMETDPTKRIEMLQGALNATGKSFQDMSYYEKKAIADAAGLASTADLAKVMKGEFEGLAGGIGKSEAELEALEEKSADFNTLMEEIKATMMAFAMEFEPVIKGIKKALDWFQKLDENTRSMIVKGAALAVGLKLISSLMKGGASNAEAHAAASKRTSSTMSMYTKALHKAIKIGKIGIPVFLAIAGAAKAIGYAFEHSGKMGDMLKSLKEVGAVDLGLTAMGIAKIANEVNKLDPVKAVAIKTVFDAATPKAVTQNINAGYQTSRAAAQPASGAQTLVAAPIEIRNVIEIDKRKFAEEVRRHEVGLKLANAAATGTTA